MGPYLREAVLRNNGFFQERHYRAIGIQYYFLWLEAKIKKEALLSYWWSRHHYWLLSFICKIQLIEELMSFFISAVEENAKLWIKPPSNIPPPNNSFLQISPWRLSRAFTVFEDHRDMESTSSMMGVQVFKWSKSGGMFQSRNICWKTTLPLSETYQTIINACKSFDLKEKNML